MENEQQTRSRVSVINESILSDKNLSPAEKMVYARICYFEEFFESAESTAEYLGVKIWTVQSAKRKLEKLGYIKCVKNTGRGKRYVADVNFGLGENDVRVCSEQSQMLVKTKSDVGENKVRLWKNQDIGKNISKNIGKKENNVGRFQKPSVEEVRAYCEERKNKVDAESFVDFYESKGWVVGKSPMKNWKAAVRTWERNGYGQSDNRVVKVDEVHVVAEGEDITYQRMFEKWKQYLGVGLKQTESQVKACNELLEDLGEDGLERLIVALRMRSEHGFLTRELKSVKDFVTLNDNKMVVQNFYNEHWRMWQMKQEANQQGKKIWEL